MEANVFRAALSRSRRGIFALAVIAGSIVPAAAEPSGKPAWPSAVSSQYKLYFNGFDVGSYTYDAKSNGKVYSANSSANISALFGAFKWKGTIEATGAVGEGMPKPATYLMNYKTKSKAGVVRLGFEKGNVKTLTVEPKKEPSPEAVPVKPEHLQGVLDPIGAVLAMTIAGSGKPCDKKIAVFDGKVRSNLILSYKGQEKLAEKKPSGQPGNLVVCKVKYEPVAGHKPKDFQSPWVSYDAIEIALRPIPSAGIYVPYKITIPTTIGAAVMSAERVDITAPNNTVIALTQ